MLAVGGARRVILASGWDVGSGGRQLTETAVGYGTTGLSRGEGGPPQFVYPDVRMCGGTRSST